MALNTNVAKAAAKAALDAVVDLIDGGTAANPRVWIYSGAQPASPDAAAGTGTKLADIDLGTAAAFGAAATGTGTEAGYVVATLANVPVTDTSADATGTAAWFRAVDKDDTPIISGSVGTATADMIIDNASIAAGQNVKLNSWKVRLPFK